MASPRPLQRLVQVVLYGAVREKHRRLVFLRTDDVCRVLVTDGGPRTLTEPDFTDHEALLQELARLANADLDEDGTGRGEIAIDGDEHGTWRARVAFDAGWRGEGRAVVELAQA